MPEINEHTGSRPNLHYPTHYKATLFIQFLLSAILLFVVSEIVPLRYLFLGCILLSLLVLITYLLIFNRRNIWIRTFGRVLSIVLSICLAFGCVYVQKFNHLVENISGATTETVEVSLVVLKESSYTSPADVCDSLIGYNTTYDEALIAPVTDLITKDAGIVPSFDSYTKYKYLGYDLYNNVVNAIIFDETHRDLLEHYYEDFESRTRVIATYSIEFEQKLAATSVDDITNDCFIIYLSGIDNRGEMTYKARSDANMLIVVNPTTHQVLLLGIPRDYYVMIPAYGGKDKLTHSGNFGVDSTIETIDQLLGIDINYYVRINFTATVDIINAMDGVDVYSPTSFMTLDDKYQINEGMNHMNGKKALYFMRTRYIAGGDNTRVSNQIRVAKAMIKKMMDPAVFASSYTGVLKAAEKTVQTNLTSNEIMNLIQMQLSDMPSWDVQNYQLTGTDSSANGSMYVMEPNPESVSNASELVKQVLNNEIINLEKIDE